MARDHNAYNKKRYAQNKIPGGWQAAIGVPREMTQSRLCLKPARVPGVAPLCEDELRTWRMERPVSLYKVKGFFKAP